MEYWQRSAAEEAEIGALREEQAARWGDDPTTAESLDAFRKYLTTLTLDELAELHKYDSADDASYWYLIPLVAEEIGRREKMEVAPSHFERDADADAAIERAEMREHYL